VGEPWEVCITIDFLVKNSSLPLWLLERGKEVKETPTLVVTSTTRTHASLSGEPNLRINPCVLCAYFCCDYLRLLVLHCLSPSPSSYFLGFGPNLQIGGTPRSRKHLDYFILLLGSGVVSYCLHKVYLGTCSSFSIGVESSDIHHNF